LAFFFKKDAQQAGFECNIDAFWQENSLIDDRCEEKEYTSYKQHDENKIAITTFNKV